MKSPLLTLRALRTRMTWPARALAAAGTLALAALLTACGSATAAGGAQATATCPPAPAFSTVTGSITALGSGTMTVKDSTGASVTVALSSTTRYTLMTAVSASSLTAGTPVLVLTDTNATTARSIRVLSGTGGGPSGNGGNGGFGGARGTPRAGFNTACARNFGGGQGGGPGGTLGGGFEGLRGTVDSATSANLTFDDAQGQTYSVAITSSTTIEKAAAGQASDLKVGEHVTAVGQKTSGEMTARNVTIQAA